MTEQEKAAETLETLLDDLGITDEANRLISSYVALRDAPAEKKDEQARSNERAMAERLNSVYWRIILKRLEDIPNDSPPDALDFKEGDRLLFDYGWTDQRLFPAERLAQEAGEGDPEYRILSLTEWMKIVDARYLEVEKRSQIAAGLRAVASDLASMPKTIENLYRRRAEFQADNVREPDLAELAELQKTVETTAPTLMELETRKRHGGIKGDKVKEYNRCYDVIHDGNQKIAKVLNKYSGVRKQIMALSRKICDCQRIALTLKERHEKLRSLESDAKKELEQKLALRKVNLQDRLIEIREDITMCARWGRTAPSSMLLSERQIVARHEAIEAIRRIEDYDPRLFANRHVRLHGRPTVILTPGTGNGSYDFRSNILIIPVTAPQSILESAAYALALYKRDVDRETNEGRLWASFLGDVNWPKIKGPAPKGLQAQIREFVACYIKWTTKEAAGLSVLETELREWFEANIAPKSAWVIEPRHLRDLGGQKRTQMIEALLKADPTAEVLYDAGVLYYQIGDVPKAYEAFSKAAALDPRKPEPHWALGHVLSMKTDAQVGDPRLKARLAAAKEGFAKFIELAPQSWWVRVAQRNIAAIETQAQEIAEK